MARVIAVGPGGRAQAPARRDVCRAVIEEVRSSGLLDQLLLSPACRTLAQAERLADDLYLSARYYCSCGKLYCTRRHSNIPPDDGCPHGGQRISCQAEVVHWQDPADGKTKFRVQFRLMDKREAMRHVIARYGPDPNQWPYFARRKQLKEKRRRNA